MKRIVLATALAAGVAVGVAVADEPKAVTFTKADLGKVPSGWKAAQTGKGAGVWKVVEDRTAPSKSGFALAQTSDARDALFNLCVMEDRASRTWRCRSRSRPARARRTVAAGSCGGTPMRTITTSPA